MVTPPTDRRNDRCPTCGVPITGIAADGPGSYRLDACGHDASLLTVEQAAAAGDPPVTDAGTIVPASPALGESAIQ